MKRRASAVAGACSPSARWPWSPVARPGARASSGELDDAIQELTLPLRHEDIIRQQAEEKDVDASLIAAVIYAESKFRDRTSSAGARGLMQITPQAADGHRAAQRRHDLRARRPLRPGNQHPLRHLPPARTPRPLRRRRGRRPRRLQRRPDQRRQVGRKRAEPRATSRSPKPAPTSKTCSTSSGAYREQVRRGSWAI